MTAPRRERSSWLTVLLGLALAVACHPVGSPIGEAGPSGVGGVAGDQGPAPEAGSPNKAGTAGGFVGGAAGANPAGAGGDAPITTCLNASLALGGTAYPQINAIFGADAYEVPDAKHSPAATHITLGSDDIAGDHFVFTLHRDLDSDTSSQQTCMLKVYETSPDYLKGYPGQRLIYTWRFWVPTDFPVGTSFTHFFELLGVGGNAGTPVISLTGARTNSQDQLQVRYNDGTNTQILDEAIWKDVRGEWYDVRVEATFSRTGTLVMWVRPVAHPDLPVININKSDLDLVRDSSYVRPKWGIFRSMSDLASFVNSEDSVHMASFGITRNGQSPTTECHLK